MNSVVDFAYAVLDMQSRINFLERELEHYKRLHEMNCEAMNRTDRNTKEMAGLVFKSLLDPNSVLNKGHAAIFAEKAAAERVSDG